MSTQFFARQDAARSNTIWLVALFVIAVIGLVTITAAVVYFAGVGIANQNSVRQLAAPSGRTQANPAVMAALAAVATLIVILLGSLYQITILRWGGGTRVAEMVGGRPIAGQGGSPAEQRLMNIVEEMALASGTPVPPVYVMDEDAINAFAAGYLPGDAVIGVTRGAVETLNREELQGVVAHEFSHILNGDMRMNIRMIGVLHGILLLGIIGRFLVRSIHLSGGSRSRSSKDSGGGAVLAILAAGVALIVVGSLGSFIGGLIKAAVSRQREYLADASAVQFTRNPGGIAGALKKIAGISQHGMLKHPNAGIASHMYFSQGVFEGLTGLLATHPPLDKRIRAIEPSWDGRLPGINRGSDSAIGAATMSSPQRPLAPGGRAPGGRVPGGMTAGMAAGFAGNGGAAATAAGGQLADHDVPLPTVMAAADQIGEPVKAHRQYTVALLKEIDPVVQQAAHETYSARALVLALLISDDDPVRQRQYQSLDQTITADVVELTRKLETRLQRLPEAARLPLVDLALPALRQMSARQYNAFSQAFQQLVAADQRITIFEWTLAQVLIRHLKRQYLPMPSTATKYHRLGGLAAELSLLFSCLAGAGHNREDEADSFAVAAQHFPAISLQWQPPTERSFRQLEAALAKLATASVHRRGEIVQACAACVCADGLVKIREAELLRGISDLLDCPMPPLVGRMEGDRTAE